MNNVKPGQLRCAEHTDWGAITLLVQDDVGGLEVKKATVNIRPSKKKINKQTNVFHPRSLWVSVKRGVWNGSGFIFFLKNAVLALGLGLGLKPALTLTLTPRFTDTRPLHFLFVTGNVGTNKTTTMRYFQHQAVYNPPTTGVAFHKKKPLDVFHSPCLLRYTVRCITLLKHVSNQICVKSLSDVSIVIFDR